MRTYPIAALTLGAVLLVSAVTTVDAARRSRAPAIDCEAYARSATYNAGVLPGLSFPIIGDTFLGSAAGFGIGSIWAASGIGAAIGAGAGLIVGVVTQAQADDAYRVAYQNCIARGGQ